MENNLKRSSSVANTRLSEEELKSLRKVRTKPSIDSDFSQTVIFRDDVDTSCDNLLIEEFDDLEFSNFVYFVADIFSDYGFRIEMLRKNSIHGIVFFAYTPQNEKIGVLVKRYKGNRNVGIQSVQQAFSAKIHYECDVAVVFTNNYFTKNARLLAESTEIQLYDKRHIDNYLVYGEVER